MIPVPYDSFEAPHPEQAADMNCIDIQNDGTCKIKSSRCPNAYCNEDNILVDAKRVNIKKIELDIPWRENMTEREKKKRWKEGNDNR